MNNLFFEEKFPHRQVMEMRQHFLRSGARGARGAQWLPNTPHDTSGNGNASAFPTERSARSARSGVAHFSASMYISAPIVI